MWWARKAFWATSVALFFAFGFSGAVREPVELRCEDLTSWQSTCRWRMYIKLKLWERACSRRRSTSQLIKSGCTQVQMWEPAPGGVPTKAMWVALGVFLRVYISDAAVTSAGGSALTAGHFFKRQKVTKRLPLTSGPSLRLGVPSLRHSSGGIALRLASLHLHAMSSTASNGAARQSPDEHLHSASRRGGWIKSKIKSRSKSKIKSAAS